MRQRVERRTQSIESAPPPAGKTEKKRPSTASSPQTTLKSRTGTSQQVLTATGFVVADGRGNIMSVIQSLYKSFGSVVVAPDTGVVLQNRGAYFNTDPAHPNCFAPGKRPARTCVGVTALARGARIEIDFVARRPA